MNIPENSLFKLCTVKTEQSDLSERAKLLKDYFDTVIEALNKEANRLHGAISFQAPSDEDIANLVGQIPSAAKFSDEFEKIYPEQIASAFEVMRSIIVDDLAHEHVTGLTQMGKSGLITVLMDFLGIVSYILTNNRKILLPIAWLPNAINMEKQSIQKLAQSSLLNGYISVKVAESSPIKLRQFNDLVKAKMAGLISNAIDTKAQYGVIEVTHKTKLLREIGEFFGTTDERSALVLRRSTVSDQMYKWLFQAASESPSIDGFAEVNIALIMDESHIAIGKGQGTDRALGLNTADWTCKLPAMGPADCDDPDESDGDGSTVEDLTDAEECQVREEESEYMEEFKEQHAITSTYSSIFRNKAKLVTVSATNTPWNCINYRQGKNPVFLKVASGYCGFAFVDGQDYPLEEGIEVVEPIVLPMRDLAVAVPGVKHLNLRHLDSAVSYAQSLESEDWQTIAGILNENMALLAARLRDPIRKTLKTFGDDGHARNRSAKTLDAIFDSRGRELMELANFIKTRCQLNQLLSDSEFKSLFTLTNARSRKAKLQRLCASEKSLDLAWKQSYAQAQGALASLLKYLLLDVNPQNKRGCILRWECKNESFNSFIQPLESSLGNRIRFIPYMASSASQTVSDLLAKVNPANDPYVIVVTGRGRYGESYPSDCGYAIDGTTKNASAAAFFQSLLGRISGYKKYERANPDGTRPMLILSDLAYDQVFLELKKGKGYSPKVGTGANLVKTGLDFKPIENVCILRNPNDTELERLFEQLDRPLVAYRGLSLSTLSRNLQSNLYNSIAPIAKYVELKPSLALDRLGEMGLSHAEGLRFLEPGETMEDDSRRMLDWHDRRESETTPPANARPFVAFEFFAGGKKRFGLTSLRNNKLGAEYLHSGLQLDRDSFQVMAIWLWLAAPLQSAVTGPVDGAVTNKRGSVPHAIEVGTRVHSSVEISQAS